MGILIFVGDQGVQKRTCIIFITIYLKNRRWNNQASSLTGVEIWVWPTPAYLRQTITSRHTNVVSPTRRGSNLREKKQTAANGRPDGHHWG